MVSVLAVIVDWAAAISVSVFAVIVAWAADISASVFSIIDVWALAIASERDFKFIAANSLGTIFKHEDTPQQTNFAFNNEVVENITKVRVKYFNFQGDSNKRNKYRKDFEKIVNKQDSFFETEDLR